MDARSATDVEETRSMQRVPQEPTKCKPGLCDSRLVDVLSKTRPVLPEGEVGLERCSLLQHEAPLREEAYRVFARQASRFPLAKAHPPALQARRGGDRL